jgi:ATP-binding cassette subfamily B protein
VFPGLVVIRSNQASLADTLDLLEQPMPEHARQGDVPPLVFERNIRLDDVYFRYSPESDWVLRGVSLEIPKGRRVGVMGETGCGKSTMLDIVMGLLSPTSGSLAVDGVVIGADNGNGWQAHIAHVPQSVFLADSSIASNIALASLSMR